MYEFRMSEDIWTEQVTFCISVTINNLVLVNEVNDKREMTLVFLWFMTAFYM